MSQLSYTNLQDGETPTASGFNTRFLLAINLLNNGIESDNLGALSVTTAKIATGAVTGPKIAMGSDAQGDVLYHNGTSYTRLGAGTSGQFLKTNGASANPSWASVSTSQYRDGLFVTQTGTTTMSVGLGRLEVNGSEITKTSATTLTLSTAGDWAGGVSLRAVSTYGYVGVDTAGNIKMHTTAPSHSDYAVSNTSGIKRYATWSGTVYRIIGWFYMNATGSGELNSYEVGNLRDGSVFNSVMAQSSTTQSLSSTTYEDVNTTTIRFYSSGRPVRYSLNLSYSVSTGITDISTIHNFDGSDITASEKIAGVNAASYHGLTQNEWHDTPAQGPHTYKIRHKVSGGTVTKKNCTYSLTEL